MSYGRFATYVIPYELYKEINNVKLHIVNAIETLNPSDICQIIPMACPLANHIDDTPMIAHFHAGTWGKDGQPDMTQEDWYALSMRVYQMMKSIPMT